MGEAASTPGTFGQATARPGGRRVGTSPEDVAARSPIRPARHAVRGEARQGQNEQHILQDAEESDGQQLQRQGHEVASRGARLIAQRQQGRGGGQHQPLLSDSDHSRSPSPQPH